MTRDTALVDKQFFEPPEVEKWVWELPNPVRVHELERAASSARIEGWSMDDTSILYHLVREKNSTPYVSMMAEIVAAKVKTAPEAVLRFLYRYGYIMLKN